MELRSYNVVRVYKESVQCKIGEDLGIRKDVFNEYIPEIKDMLSQISTYKNRAHLCSCNRRKDGETWTPYLQIVEMLILMGARAGFVEYEKPLKAESVITFKL